MTNERVWSDIGYAVQAVLHENGVLIHFKVFEVFGTEAESGAPFFTREREDGRGSDPVALMDTATVVISGSVKWDGCVDVWFNQVERGSCLHFCERQGVMNLGELLGRIHELGEEMIGDKWDRQVLQLVPNPRTS